MSWFRQEQNFISHPKFIQLSDGSFRLWHEGKCWVESNLSDGILPFSVVKGFRYYKPKRAQGLLDAPHGYQFGLWEVIEGVGYKMHDYLYFNPSREEVLARRESDAERKRLGRERRQNARIAAECPPGRPDGQDAGRPPLSPPSVQHFDLGKSKSKSKKEYVRTPTAPESQSAQAALDRPTPGSVFTGGAVAKPKPAAAPPGKNRPRFVGKRFKVFSWTYEKAEGKLGSAFEAFDFDVWLHTLDLRVQRDPGTMPPESQHERWLLTELDAEIKLRGLRRIGVSDEDPYANLPKFWTCKTCGLVHEGTRSQARAGFCPGPEHRADGYEAH